MKTGATLGLWIVLLGVLGLEFFAARTALGSMIAPLLGVAMALTLSLTFMRLPSATPLAKIFAIAGLFWLCVLMGLGGLDSATRHDIPAATRTQP